MMNAISRLGRPGTVHADLPLAPKSVSVLHAAIHRAFKKAVKDRLLTVNPAVDLERRKPDADAPTAQAQQHCLTATEARRVIEAATAARRSWRRSHT